MVVYGELLFLENAVTGGILLWITKSLCGGTLRSYGYLTGAVLCGLYSFSLFLGDRGWILPVLEKILFSLGLIYLCFRPGRGILHWIVFFSASFFMGGITMGLAGLFSVPAVSGNGSLYVEQFTYLHIISGCGATVLLMYLMMELIGEKKYNMAVKKRVVITSNGKTIATNGFLDTGNRLKDPVSGLPVCLVSSDLKRELGLDPESLRPVRYRAATGEEGTVKVWIPEEMIIEDKGTIKKCSVAIGTIQKEEAWQWEGCDVLLNGNLMEGVL